MNRIYFNLVLSLLLACNVINAQEDSSQQVLFNRIYSAAETEYGIHQELLNGILFEEKNQDAIGHPYLLNYFSNQGRLIYRGKQYSNLFLRYDIYDQQVLLIYPYNNIKYKLYLPKEFITGFTIGNKKFINEAYGTDEDAKFYQLIGEDLPIKVFRYWKKGLTNRYANNSGTKMFSENKETYILLNNELHAFKGNRSFTRRFSSNSRTAIRKYFRKNKTRVKHADDDEMEQLVEFINTMAG